MAIFINLLQVTFEREGDLEEFMDIVEGTNSVFSFECVGVDTELDSVSFKPVEDGVLYLFITEDEDVKGETLVLSEEFSKANFDYLVICPEKENEVLHSVNIVAGEVLSSQSIVGPAATLIGEMARGGFA